MYKRVCQQPEGIMNPVHFPESQRAPQVISIFLHPFVMVILTFGIVLFSSQPVSSWTWIYFGIIIISTVLLPFIQVVWMKKKGKTASLDIPERERRSIPSIQGVLNYFLALVALWFFEAPKPILILMWVYLFNTLIAIIITYYWKVSVHGMAIGGPVACLGYLISPYIYWFLLLLPLITYSRVSLKAHTPMQVITGFVLGFVLTLIQFKMMMPL